jgi:hypothetical protein
MIFEMTGSLAGVLGIGVPMLMLYRRQLNRAMTTPGARRGI